MNPEQIVWPKARKVEKPDNQMQDAFTEFINRPAYTVDQVRTAYYQLMGVSEPGSTDDPAVAVILAEMQRLEAAHFPVNRFAEFIGTLQKLEDAVPVYLSFVDQLPVSANEKSMLYSIVQKQRSGELEIAIGGRPVARIQIKNIEDDPELMATELLHALRRVTARVTTGQSLEFTFVE